MSKSIALGLLCAGAILLAILLTGCSGSTPEPTPLSLDEYLSLCAPTDEELADDATFGEFSSLFAEELDKLEGLTPPAQLSEWHLLNIENYRTIQAVFDTYPKDDVVDFANFLLIAAASDELEEKLGEVAVRLPEDVLQRMIEAGCIDPDVAPDEYGYDFESATRIAIGEAVAIEFESPDDEGMFVFLGEPGVEYVFTLDWEGWFRLSDPWRPIMVLFDAGGQELARLEGDDSSQNMMMWQAVTGGDYYIAVGDGATFGSLTLTVTVGGAAEPLDRDDHGNSEGDATAIGVGADVRGALDYDDDIDFFRFQAERGQSYQIDVALGTLDDSIVELYDVDWSFLNTNDDYGETNASRLYWEAPSSGERYVLVGGYGTGTYTLTVSLSDLIDDHGNSEGDATAIRVGTDVRGAVDYDDDIDFFRFQAERGQTYRIDVALGTLDDSIVELYDTDWSFLDTNDDYGDTYASRLYWEAPSSGERYVLVGGAYTSSQGTYTLTVSLIIDDHANSEGGATAIRAGAGVRGVLDYDGDIDYFRFQAEQGKFYQIDVALGTLDDSQLVLLGPDDWELAYNDDHGNTYASRLSWEAPSSGERYVAVEGYGIGTYTLTVSIIDDHGNSEGDATAIRVGTDVRGAVDYDDDIDFFRFQAERGQTYRIDVALGTLDDSIVELYDTDWSFLDTNDDYGDTYASRLYWEAPSSGERYVLVGGAYTSSQGTYTLTVSLIIDDHANSEGGATAIRAGAGVRGVLDYDGDIDYFRFQAEQGKFYQIDVALGTLDDSQLVLLGPDDWELAYNDDHGNTYASRLSWEAPSSGERYVAVEGYGIGTYTLTVSIIDDHGNDFASATRIAIGETVPFELENDDDLDVLVFRARPGTEYLLTLNWEYYSFRVSSTERPLLAVYSSNGQEQTRLMGYDFREIEVPSIVLHWRTLTGGDYYIVIGDGNTEGAGEFSVTEW